MGFMDSMLEKSERRALLAVIDGLESLDGSVEFGVEQITCSENPNYKHLAIRAELPSEAGFFHRCRNDWYFSVTTDGRKYVHLHAVDKFNRNLAIAQLSMIVRAAMEAS
jgi:hypothetical protein